MTTMAALFGLALLALGSSAQTVPFDVFRRAIERLGPVPEWYESRSAYPVSFYDRGQEALLAYGLLPSDSLSTILPAPPPIEPLGTDGIQALDTGAVVSTIASKPVVNVRSTVTPSFASEPVWYSRSTVRPSYQAERVTVHEHPVSTLVKKTGFVLAPKPVEFVERQVIRTPVIEKQVAPIIQKSYQVVPPPVVRKFFQVLPPPVVRKSYQITPPPVVQKVLKVLPAPIINKNYHVVPPPVVKRVYNVLPAPVVQRSYQINPAPIVKKIYQVNPPPVVEKKFNILPAPVVKRFYQVMPTPVIQKYINPTPIVKKVFVTPPPVVKKYVVSPPPVIRNFVQPQQPQLARRFFLVPPASVKNIFNIVKQPHPLVVEPTPAPLAEVRLVTAPAPAQRTQKLEVKEEDKSVDKAEEHTKVEVPLKEVEVEVPSVKTVGKVVLVETVRHVLDVDTFDKDTANAPAPTRSEETVVDADGTVRKIEKYVVYDQVPYTQKILTRVPVTAVDGKQIFLEGKAAALGLQQASSSSSSSKSSLSSSSLSSLGRLSSLSSLSNGRLSSLSNLSNGRLIDAHLVNPSLQTVLTSGTSGLARLSGASGSRFSSSSSSSQSSSSLSGAPAAGTVRGVESLLLERPGNDASLVSFGAARDDALFDEVTKQQLLSSAARFEQSSRQRLTGAAALGLAEQRSLGGRSLSSPLKEATLADESAGKKSVMEPAIAMTPSPVSQA